MQIIFNNKTYNSLEEMPANEREAYESMFKIFKDENGNGIPDDFNCRCKSDADCSGGQICYTHTAYACGIPCDNFFGDVCPFVAAGSFCNAVTQQCEF